MTSRLEVLYHDTHLLALNKPAGLLTQPGSLGRDNLEDRAKAWIKDRKNKPGAVYLHAAHRLDRAVSGIVVCACTSKALIRLQEAQRNRRLEKVYHAVITGVLPHAQGALEHLLVHASHHAQVVARNHPGARECRLEYRVLRRRGKRSLLEMRIITGRYHQIRAQLAACGCPILGDRKYGSSTTLPDGAIALHHVRLRLCHPVSREPLDLYAPYPERFPVS